MNRNQQKRKGPSASLSRRGLLIGAGSVAVGAGLTITLFSENSQAPGTPIRVFRSLSCICCGKWVAYLREAGFAPHVELTDDLRALRQSFGMPKQLASCHIAQIEDRWAIEGHVPAEDIRKLLTMKPDARGLVAPGMPLGSPGMEIPNRVPDSFEVMLVKADGTYESFSRHG
jgi:hypothetical protein